MHDWLPKYVIFILEDCGSPDSPENGAVSTISGTTFGNIATYTCNEGYNLIGVSDVTCPAVGSWPTPYPSCQISKFVCSACASI